MAKLSQKVDCQKEQPLKEAKKQSQTLKSSLKSEEIRTKWRGLFKSGKALYNRLEKNRYNPSRESQQTQ